MWKEKNIQKKKVSSEFSGSFKQDKNDFDKNLADINKIKTNEGTNVWQKVFKSLYNAFRNCFV